MSFFVEFLGWFGAVTVLTGYILFSLGRIPNGPAYQLFNLVGGLSVAVNVLSHGAIPSTIVNGIWAAIAAVVLVRMLRSRKAGASVATSTDLEARVTSAEPPATTMVLPVIGPAVRDHDGSPATGGIPLVGAFATDIAGEATASDATVNATDAALPTMPLDRTTPATAADADQAAPSLQAVPLADSVPAVTAAIAIALVAAAQEHAAQEQTTHQRDVRETAPTE